MFLQLFTIWMFLFLLLPAGFAADREQDPENAYPQNKPAFVLDEVVVTASREDEVVRKLPSHVTVITKEDIAKSSASSVVDLLSAEGGLVQRGFLGNDKKSSIDIRGMGETSVSNVLVLVDGIRHNPSDMAGPDFSTLSMDQIERIEIIHGAGSILHGDGAVGGVINIITKPAGKGPGAYLRLETGSYESIQTTARLNHSLNKTHLSLLGNFSDTDGYREKGTMRNANTELNLEYDASNRLALFCKARYHNDRYGFPGPLTIPQFEKNPRQTTDPTNSHGNTTEKVAASGFDYDAGSYGVVSGKITHNKRENTWVMLWTPGEIEESTWIANIKHNWELSFGDHNNQLTYGIDLQHTEYSQGTSFAKKPYDLDHIGYFALNRFTFRDSWIIQSGYRHHRYSNQNRSSGMETKWLSNVYTMGIVKLLHYSPCCEGSLFSNYTTSFRIPDIDELGFATDNIRPQKGRHWDFGGKLLLHKKAEINLTLFDIYMEDEIWFDASRYINTNYQHPTRRKGLETELRVYPVESVRIWMNHTYTRAEFEGIDYKVPTVPAHKCSAGLNWEIRNWIEIGTTYLYVGERPQGGNPIVGSQYPDMPAYDVWSAKITMQYRPYHLKFYLTVNNLLDETYYTSSYYNNVYPSPERNFLAGLIWEY
ncbi:MAG: TonB-dependent receptor [Pseudomonadota bacterium]